MEKTLVRWLSFRRVIYLFSFIWVVFLGLVGFLYWQGYIQQVALILLGIIALIVAIVFIIGVRIAQRDGFMNGFKNGRDGTHRV